ncbi:MULTISPECIES: anhydro-N-acetylmuramic acid kinase [unclassified Thioalkalivibrio]|uniref:anhydro-N-acetylmuramic acid kinase n=1 Tax=unclassified Thioalkalivibrio TaxID=2621013 RepID=UPI00039E77E9|nr:MULTISPECIES: anhydro-N-acetylmuramic acid kinase [unclassified Thioalkalivibrio]
MTQRLIGLMSGTSRDGVDAVLVEIDDGRTLRTRGHCHLPYPDALEEDLAAAATTEALRFEDLGTLDARVGLFLARAVDRLLEATGLQATDIEAIGSHGQTVHHAPGAEPAFTWQIGDPFRIAEATGIDVIAHFRQRDLAAGGEGAPLACAFHADWLGHPTETRAILNLGGIANLTWLEPGQPVRGCDSGPANTLLDGWARRHLGQPYDAGGAWARTGHTDPSLLAQLLEDPYFLRPAPKSTGPEHFSPHWLRQVGGEQLDRMNAEDVQATLVELTVDGVRLTLESLRAAAPDRVIVCGGGAHNGYLMERLQSRLAGSKVESSERHGIPPQQVEGAAFAWLAYRHLRGEAGNLPEVTGARGPRILGCRIPGRAPEST